MSNVTPQPPLLYLKERLRARLVEVELVDDPALLALLADGYVDACEASRCLQRLDTITLTTAQEYPLPASWVETLAVVVNGRRVDPIALRDSLADRGVGAPTVRYTYGRTMGFSPAPTGGTALHLYVESPVRFTTWQDTLDPRFPTERLYALAHYARWRVLMMAGGAQKIGLAQTERTWYDDAVRKMQRAGRVVGDVGPSHVRLNRGQILAR